MGGSLWKRQMIEDSRRIRVDATLGRIVVAIDLNKPKLDVAIPSEVKIHVVYDGSGGRSE